MSRYELIFRKFGLTQPWTLDLDLHAAKVGGFSKRLGLNWAVHATLAITLYLDLSYLRNIKFICGERERGASILVSKD